MSGLPEDEKDPYAIHETWGDRLSADAVRNPVLAELVAQCQKCGDVLTVEIGGSPRRWIIRNGRITRDLRGTWRHLRCGGRLRFHGRLPEARPDRIVVEGEEYRG